VVLVAVAVAAAAVERWTRLTRRRARVAVDARDGLGMVSGASLMRCMGRGRRGMKNTPTGAMAVAVRGSGGACWSRVLWQSTNGRGTR
jgi:hypothetical protein